MKRTILALAAADAAAQEGAEPGDPMIKRTGGAYVSATIATAIPGRLKVMAGRIAEQYKQVSPEKAPTEEFRRLPPRK